MKASSCGEKFWHLIFFYTVMGTVLNIPRTSFLCSTPLLVNLIYRYSVNRYGTFLKGSRS
jgi:hypothetical protein